MTEKKITGASKQEDKSQDKFDKERLIDDELDKVAGGFNMPEPIPMDIAGDTMGK